MSLGGVVSRLIGYAFVAHRFVRGEWLALEAEEVEAAVTAGLEEANVQIDEHLEAEAEKLREMSRGGVMKNGDAAKAAMAFEIARVKLAEQKRKEAQR
jgi:hypothetical protein